MINYHQLCGLQNRRGKCFNLRPLRADSVEPGLKPSTQTSPYSRNLLGSRRVIKKNTFLIKMTCGPVDVVQ